MRTTQWARAAAIFAEIIELPAVERAMRLDVLSGSDAQLRAAVERLLRLEDSADSGAEFETEIRRVVHSGALIGALKEGEQLGSFRIVRALGEGGMGQVYLAERDIDGVMQRVALKVPMQRPGAQFAERFRRERSILAGLTHPAIARLVDTGALDDGRPYFAMEYVDGLPITDYCDQQQLSIEQRLRLFLRVLPAVQHAHENLFLHRDIKPANVLVGSDGLPRLLDFGIAKSFDVLIDKALTQEEARFFSLASAAPEQVNGAATSVATDIYALGVLLYELVCGLPALDLQDMAPSQALGAITDQVPATPAAALSALLLRDAERAQLLAEKRALGSALTLSKLCRGDLELILARALRKEPRARYASAEAFARDLNALLEHRPIAQRHADRWYRFERFIRRHRIAVSSLALVLAFSVSYLFLAWRQAEALALARDRAEAGRAEAEQVTEFLIGLFRHADPTVARGSNPDAKQMLERGAAALQSELGDQPELRARLMTTLADIYLSLNDFANSRLYAEQAVAIRAAIGTQDASVRRASLEQLTRVALAQARYADALRLLDEALSAKAIGPAVDDDDLHLFALRATALSASGDRDQALSLFALLDAQMQQRFGPQDARTRALQRSWSITLSGAGQTERAREMAKLYVGDSTVPSLSNDPDAGKLAREQAALLRDDDDLIAAADMAQEALRIATVVYGEWHLETSSARTMLGTIAQQQKDYAAAAEHFERSMAITERLLPSTDPRHAMAEYNLGLLHLYYQENLAAALPRLRRAVELGERSLPAEHPNLALFRAALGQALLDARDYRGARAMLGQALQIFRKIAAPRGRSEASAVGEIACIDLITARDELRARKLLQDAIELLTREMPAGHPKFMRLQRCLQAHSS